MYVSYHKYDWHTWLPLAEFAYNNAEHSSTKQLPFFTIYGRNPSFDSIHLSQDTPAGKLSTKLQSVQKVVKEELESAMKRFKKYADRNRAISPDLQPGDKVWLASKNINTTRPTKKLSEDGWDPLKFSRRLAAMHITSTFLNNGMEWKGFNEDLERTTWEPASNLTNSPDLVKDFHTLYPDKPGPNAS
ncbi:hypothetical protein O181_035589 [Austropuccinia psidii MF-1]|uniref:Chromo domain-containing protein n=1 Tax=Austropuccinia psidii MF-1 TaxID=1389203 RepID=A0A9Q3D2X9_9BASI|nr:hypothetical protein [Austropuccinia psidii MF-1]